jgi:hypothetical protein
MIPKKLRSRQFGFMVFGLLLTGLAAGLAIDVVRDFVHPERTQPRRLERRELALRGDLELERAVQALKDSILRGESVYTEDFTRHMEEVDRSAFLYRDGGALDQTEEEALRKLREAVPRYQAAIYAVHRMRARAAPISEIDMAVKGVDRPISAAFGELESAASDQNPFGRSLSREATIVLLCAALAVTSLYFSFVSPKHVGGGLAADERALRDLSIRIVRWEEQKEAKAYSVLHEVCQSLSAVMCLAKGAAHFATDHANASIRANLEPIVPSLKAAIRETVEIALDLRPPQLHEAGLLVTLDSIWADCPVPRPGLDIAARTGLNEEDIPEELKPVILRIGRMAFDWAVQESATRRLTWDLALKQNQIRLSVQLLYGSGAGRGGASTRPSREATSNLWDVICARVVLSGGTSDGARDIRGGQTMLAVWPLAVRQHALKPGPDR